MDDARIADEMTLDGIAKQLNAIREDIAGVKADGTRQSGALASLRSEIREGFNASTIRDEELRALAKLGLEANQGLLETTTARFDATDKKHDEELGLLKAAVRSSITRRPRRRP